jgi:hypothetical protein
LFQENRIGQPLKTKSATEKRFYDGAAIATLKSRFKDETYKSPSFDHGFPKNIEQFVNKINSFVKQKMKIKEIQDEIVDEFSMFDD